MKHQDSAPLARGNEDSSEPDIAPSETHASDAIEEETYEIARFELSNDHRLIFSFEAETGDLGLLEEGRAELSAPAFLADRFTSVVEAYLHVAEARLPVPEELLEDAIEDSTLRERLTARDICAECVQATSSSEAFRASTAVSAGQTCFSTYYSWWDWHDAATPGLAPKAYYASQFGGKRRYSQSYIANCAPFGWGDWLWARHRIYYKKANGSYKKHFEGKVKPGHWQAKTKGSVKRWRRVIYDDGWNSSPSNLKLKYTREGRFLN
ncbi:MAG TPA: hypothetical protein PKA33_13945 [Amaricoccus sp.]|uniref:hypothetical protein n=1 Tax=Amaricoccus sp. TaxID=1872485 RepID=UPI002C6B43A0|nr:hypothetical protein [Amaricoccus sp.]HMQ93652.1 hypothetical protein [Amaricoccus sp.]HMR53489.1 hypothetical protein [Amaricoccus sp.]HMR60584.1 hypothetical protein [Amaricoccus sp.]HMU00453.1 hypothetical protein [Amaricoccus sp.]